MLSLQSLQDTMAAAILGGDMAHIAEDFHAGPGNAAARLNIFRNNTYTSLTQCLKTVFPVTMRLADERFFAYAAHEFIAKHPPREARLSGYGAEFPRFLSSFEACKGFPVIAEMAALEWAIAESLTAPEELPIAMAMIGLAAHSGGKAGLRLQPNLRFTVSRWPLSGVWADHKRPNVVITGPLKPRVSRLAISRHGEDLQFIELDAARFAFWKALARGLTIEAAASRALARDRLFDLVHETIILFRSKLVTGVISAT